MTEQLKDSPRLTSVINHPRFIESSPEITQNLITLSEGVEELKAINQELLGATLFGSALKGTATEKSDYDTNVFVEANKLLDLGIEVAIDESSNAEIVDKSLKSEYSHYISGYLAKKLGKEPAQIEEGIFVLPISHELIDTQIDHYLKSCKERPKHNDDIDIWLNADMTETVPEEPRTVLLGRNISTLFAADLTAGLETYREHVLARLEGAGQAGEEAWQDILLVVKFGEGHVGDEYYPATVSEAINEYSRLPV